jgi:hypothetical protein
MSCKPKRAADTDTFDLKGGIRMRRLIVTLNLCWKAIVLLGMIGLLGCGGVHKPFALMDEGYRVKPTSVAVIAGSSADVDTRLAKFLTEELAKRTTLRVISQEEVEKKVPNYPQNFKMGKVPDEKKPVWYAQSEKGKLDSIQARLKADYLFLVWGSNLTAQTVSTYNGGRTTTYYISILGNLLEYPKGKPAAFTQFGNSRSQSFLALFKDKGYDVDKLLQDSAEEVTDEFITVTKAGK